MQNYHVSVVSHPKTEQVQNYHVSVVPHPKTEQVQNYHVSVVSHPKTEEVQNYHVSVVSHPKTEQVQNYHVFIVPHPKTEQVQNCHVSVVPHPKMNKCRIIKFLLRKIRNCVSSVCHCLVKLMLSHKLIAKHTCTQRAWSVVWFTQNMRRECSSFMWHQPCNNQTAL